MGIRKIKKGEHMVVGFFEPKKRTVKQQEKLRKELESPTYTKELIKHRKQTKKTFTKKEKARDYYNTLIDKTGKAYYVVLPPVLSGSLKHKYIVFSDKPYMQKVKNLQIRIKRQRKLRM